MDLLIWLTWELLGKTHKSILIREMFSLHVWGGCLRKNVSQILAMIDFSSRGITGKTLSAKNNIIGNITLKPNKSFKLEQIWRRQLHSPREIISTMCKTGQDALRKRKPCRNLFIHISNKSASNKLKNVSMESSKLLCSNGISLSSKSCKLKTFPFSIASVLTLVMDGPRPSNLKVIYFDLS